MPLLAGRYRLDELAGTPALSWAEADAICAQVADALAAAHDSALVLSTDLDN